MPDAAGVQQVVPFLGVRDIEASLGFYQAGLAFEIVHRWEPDGRLRWCWLRRGGAALMLQEFVDDGHHEPPPTGDLGTGVSLWFVCDDALAIYHEARSQGLAPARPFVGNGMWDVMLSDPDGYVIHFESPTDVDEGTVHEG